MNRSLGFVQDDGKGVVGTSRDDGRAGHLRSTRWATRSRAACPREIRQLHRRPCGGHFIGVDVGTGSARAGRVRRAGTLLARGASTADRASGTSRATSSSSRPRTSGGPVGARPRARWRKRACRRRPSPASASTRPARWSCSTSGGRPASGRPVGRPGAQHHRLDGPSRDRAGAAHQRRPATSVLRYVGGIISPEMETPKLLWLKEHLPDDLRRGRAVSSISPIILTWRATGSLARSSCTVTCKWTYLAHERRWDACLFPRASASASSADEGFARIGSEVVEPGTALGSGLTAEAAADLGLPPGTPVGAGADRRPCRRRRHGRRPRPDGRAGRCARRASPTSSALRPASWRRPRAPSFVPGVWGPYFSAMVPGLWLNEGGQSAAGAAHRPARRSPSRLPAKRRGGRDSAGMALLELLERRRRRQRFGAARQAALLARDLHVLPEFLGNRSPYADPDARAVIAGLDLDTGLESLVSGCIVAGLCGLAYGARRGRRRHARPGHCPAGRWWSAAARAEVRLVRQIMADATGISVASAGNAGAGAARRRHAGRGRGRRIPVACATPCGHVAARAVNAGCDARTDALSCGEAAGP